MLIFSVIFVFSTLYFVPRPLCLEKWGSWPPSSYGSAAPVVEVMEEARYGLWRLRADDDDDDDDDDITLLSFCRPH